MYESYTWTLPKPSPWPYRGGERSSLAATGGSAEEGDCQASGLTARPHPRAHFEEHKSREHERRGGGSRVPLPRSFPHESVIYPSARLVLLPPSVSHRGEDWGESLQRTTQRFATDALRTFAKSRSTRTRPRRATSAGDDTATATRGPPPEGHTVRTTSSWANDVERNIDARARHAHGWARLAHQPRPEGMKTTPGKPLLPGDAEGTTLWPSAVLHFGAFC